MQWSVVAWGSTIIDVSWRDLQKMLLGRLLSESGELHTMLSAAHSYRSECLYWANVDLLKSLLLCLGHSSARLLWVYFKPLMYHKAALHSLHFAFAEYQRAYSLLNSDQVLNGCCVLMCAQIYWPDGDVTAKGGACSDFIEPCNCFPSKTGRHYAFAHSILFDLR